MQEEQGTHVFGLGEAFFREFEIPRREGGVSDCFPAVFDVRFAGDFERDGEVAEGESEVEAMFRVRGYFESHLLVALSLEESGDFVLLVFGDVGKEFGRGVHVAAEHEGLVFDDGEGEVVGDDVDVFVGDVGFAVAGEVAE